METKIENKEQSRSRINPLYILIGVILAVAVVAGIYFALNASAQVVAVGDTVNVSYTGTYTNGTVFDSNVGKTPLQFTVGANQLIEGFDQGVIGMRLNEMKNITVPPNEGYGQINPALIVEIPSNTFGNQTATVGMDLRTESGQSGVVIAVNKTTVTANFNPPLAGKTLDFQIKVLAIRKG